MSQVEIGLAQQLKELIKNLTNLSDQIDPTDLGELAQIHECTLKMDQLSQEMPAPFSSLLSGFCQKVAGIAEDIILENRKEPRKDLDHLCQAIGELAISAQATDALPETEVLVHCTNLLDGQDPKDNTAPSSSASLEPCTTPSSEESSNPDTNTHPEYHPEPLILKESEFEYVQSFLTECQEHIENIETGLLTLEQTPDDLNKINELFRPFHTVKGMAGFLNLKDVQALSHEVETLLDLGRKGKIKVTPPIIDLTFESLDVLKLQVNSIGQYMADPNDKPIPQPNIEEILHRLNLATKGKFIPSMMAPPDKPMSRKPLGEILSEENDVTPEVVEFALQQQQDMVNRPVGSILTEMGAVSAREVSKALRIQKTEVQETVVRVDTAKLDSLVNMVGELVIIQTQVEQNGTTRQDPKLSRLVEQVSKITRDVQEIAMSMRMVPIAQTFHKMGRVVRDLARKVDKKINYEIEGEETELDKNVIQELSDPLMHMIRNSVDHGVETPEVRVQVGKPETGTVKLRACHQAGNIVIEIIDDGKGLDKEFLVKKAIEKGVVSPDAQLTEQQAFNLIMAPGFSTAEKVTDISGRGVGMDVVKKNIDKLRGKVEIRSTKGVGTTFTLRLPLTLAVIDGMIIRIGSQKFVLPTLSIVQSLSPTPEQIKTIQGKNQILNLRGNIYPLLALGHMFNLTDAAQDATEGMVVIAQAGDQQVGLILDELLGQQQVVIKSLGDRFKKLNGITGGAILGDGTIGLILEPAGLLEVYRRSSSV
jgi:two-component system, chemotaxis family, sensor kinase CheA